MKNRVITACLLLIFTLLLCLAGLWNGRKEYRELSALLRQAQIVAAQEDFAALAPLTDEILAQWEHWEPLGAVFLHHNDLEDIAKELAEMEISLEMENSDEYRMACYVALHRLEHIYFTELPTLPNLL